MIWLLLPVLLTVNEPSVSAPAFPVDPIDGLVAAYASLDRFAGNILIAKNGQILYETSTGAADRERNIPISVKSQFNLSGMSRLFTVIA
ncbi:hypothetical protein JW979_03220, partial [bacterium]|nr:hypothetical protein [candidate division CSSED10-310 bacterium]